MAYMRSGKGKKLKEILKDIVLTEEMLKILFDIAEEKTDDISLMILMETMLTFRIKPDKKYVVKYLYQNVD